MPWAGPLETATCALLPGESFPAPVGLLRSGFIAASPAADERQTFQSLLRRLAAHHDERFANGS